MLNSFIVMGRLVHTPELKTTQSGKDVCSFDIACERSYGANGQKETDFFHCNAWDKTAQFVSKYFQKGNMIAVSGSVQNRRYTDKNGNNRIVSEVFVREVNFCGGKAESTPKSFDAQTASHVREAKGKLDEDDFKVIDESDDLPF